VTAAAAPDGDGAPRPARLRAPVRLVVVAVVLLGCALAVSWRWAGPEPVAQADTWWYARGALVLAGVPSADAAHQASAFECAERTAVTSHRVCAERAIADPRYARIFTTRPGYPLLAAPLVGPLGVGGALRAVTAVAAIGAGLFMFVGMRRSDSGLLGAVVAVAALFLLPVGYWLTRLLADGPALLAITATVWGMLEWLDGRRRGLAVASVSLLLLFLVKSPDGVALAVATAVLGAAAALLGPRVLRRRFLAVMALGAGACLLGWGVSLVLGLPGLTETIQDLATKHFTRPDIPRPLPFLRFEDVKLLAWAWQQARVQWLGWLLVLIGTGGLVARRRWLAVPWLAAGAVGAAAVLAHPLVSEFPRLVSPTWVAVAAGLGLLVDAAVVRVPRRRPVGEALETAPDPPSGATV
jgi:hypothetical protein